MPKQNFRAQDGLYMMRKRQNPPGGFNNPELVYTSNSRTSKPTKEKLTIKQRKYQVHKH